MEIEDSEEDEGSLKDEMDYSFRKNPNSKWPNNRIPFELGQRNIEKKFYLYFFLFQL